MLTCLVFASKSRSRNRSRKLTAPSIAASGCAPFIHRLLLTRMLIPERYLRFPFAFFHNAFSYFHTLTHFCLRSFALVKTSTPALSIRCALFGEYHRGRVGKHQVKLNSSEFFSLNQRRMNTYGKRSFVQDGRPESRLGDEGSLLGTLLRKVATAREHKCFLLRTYEKTLCNPRIMNTY